MILKSLAGILESQRRQFKNVADNDRALRKSQLENVANNESKRQSTFGDATCGPVIVDLLNPRSGEHKTVKVGFSWVLFFFAGVLGIPLFLRRLYVWGAVFLVLWILYIFAPQMLPDTAHSAGTYLFLCLVFFSLQIWIAVKGNEMTAKNLLENGWSFSSPNSQESRFAMTKWNLSHSRVPENRDIQNSPPAFEQSSAQVLIPNPKISDPSSAAPIQGAMTPVQSVVSSMSTVSKSSGMIESHQRFWETKFEIYLRVCKAAGNLAVLQSDSDAFAIAEKDLIATYSGEFQFIASPDVSAALGTFVDHLQARSPDHLRAFKSEAQKLALACRQDTGADCN
jgi:hypothetical protein